MQKRELIVVILAIIVLFLSGCEKTGKAFTGIADTSLVLYLPFDEGSGTTANDLSGKGNSGTIYGAAYVDGVSGKALSFDGANDYVKISPGGLYKIQPISVEAWIKTKGTSSSSPNFGVNLIIDYEDNNGYYGWTFQVNELNKLYFRWNDYTGQSLASVITSNSAIDDGNWHHVVATDNGTAMTLYIDGNNKGSANSARPQWATAMYAYIGAVRPERGSALYWFNGSIDEVRIWDRALSASEVQQLYNAYAPSSDITNVTATGCPNNLCAYYKFDEGSGSVLQDNSGNNNSGTIYGATYVDGVSGKALSFDGVDDLVSIPDSDDWAFGTNDFTISLWVMYKSGFLFSQYPQMIGQTQTPGTIGVGRIWALNWHGQEGVSFVIRNAGASDLVGLYEGDTTQPNLNQWYYYTIVRNGGTWTLYENTAVINSATASITVPNFDGPVGIGNNPGDISAKHQWNGAIDEVRIYDRALSATEIQQIYGLLTLEKAINASQNETNVTTNITTSCTDTDGGANYDVKGTVRDSFDVSVFGPREYTDECIVYVSESGFQTRDNCSLADNRCSVREGYCLPDYYTIEAQECSNGCQDGACLLGNVKLIGQTSYSLDIMNVEFKVDVYNYPSIEVENTLPVGGYRGYYDVYTETYEDYSTDSYRTEWTSSGRFYKNDTYPQTKNITFGYYGGSLYGPAIRPGKHYRFDFYFQETPWGSYNYSKFFIKTIEFDTANITCTDSDGGINYFKKGNVSGTLYGGGTYSFIDSCGSTGALLEYFCTSVNPDSKCTEPYCSYGAFCPTGYACSDGACINTTPAITCTDTDGGKNYYVKGKVVVNSSNEPSKEYNDYCSTKPAGDSDMNPSGRYVVESFCATNNQRDAMVFECPNGCKGGACINATCVDSDGGQNYYILGTVTLRGQTYPDVCVNPTRLREGLCQNNQYIPATYNCPSGCQNGACLNATNVCTDTDKGLNYNVKGTVYGQARGNLFNITDRCTNINAVTEYYCTSTGDYSVKYGVRCPAGCSNGACVSNQTATRGILAKTGRAFGFEETTSSGAFGLVLLIVILIAIYFLVKAGKNRPRK